MIEIVLTRVEEHMLKISKLFDKNNILCFCIAASYGDLNEIKVQKIRKIGKQNLDVLEDLNNLNKAISNVNSVRIWYSSNDSEYVCNMYYLVNYLKNYNVEINLIDTYDSNHHSLINYYVEELN